jgi:hypothetical protein
MAQPRLRPIKHPICTTKKDGVAIYTCDPVHVLAYDYDKMVDRGTIFTALLAKPAIFRVRRSLPFQLLFLSVIAACSYAMMSHMVKKSLKQAEAELLALSNVTMNATLNSTNNTLLRRLQYSRRLQDEGGAGGGGAEVVVDDEQSLLTDEAAMGASTGSADVLKEKAKKTVLSYWKEQVKPLADLGMYVNAFVGFVLGLFLALSITRWWALRAGHLHGVNKAMTNLTYSLSSVLPEDVFLKVRRRMARRCILAHALLFAIARGDNGRERMQKLLDDKILTGNEHKILSRGFKELEEDSIKAHDTKHENKDFAMAMLPMLWNCNEVHRLFKEGHFAPPIVAMLHGLCMQARDGMEGVAMMVSCPLPFTYTHLICLLVHCAVLLAACKCGLQQALSKTNLQVVCEALFCLCLCAVYLGLLHLVAIIEKPFGDELLDVACAWQYQQLHRGCKLGGEKAWSKLGEVALKNIWLPQPVAKAKAAPSAPPTAPASPSKPASALPGSSGSEAPTPETIADVLGNVQTRETTSPGPLTKTPSEPEMLS